MFHCTYLAHRKLKSTLYTIKGFEVAHDEFHEYTHGIAILCKIDPLAFLPLDSAHRFCRQNYNLRARRLGSSRTKDTNIRRIFQAFDSL